MRMAFAVAILSSVLLGSGVAWATDCFPYCDYVHDYGPYDFSYIRPGLVGYPVCDWRGNCAPRLAYRYTGRRPGVRIFIRPTHPNR
jgi:hypothetical protein